jgi:hypothetical protein
MKKLKFATGGMSDSYAKAIAEGRDVIADPEDPSGSYGRAMLGEKSASKPSSPKQRVVSKKELEASGLSLRDFLNKERGLTRRNSEKDPTAGEARDKAAQRAADMMDGEVPVKKPSNKKAQPDYEFDPRVAAIIERNNAEEGRRVNRVKNALGMLPDANEAMKENARVNRLKDALGMSGRISSGTVGVEKFKHGGATKKYASGGMVSSASRRADGIAVKGKTKCRIV